VHHNVDTVYDLGLVRFRDNIARNSKIKDRLRKMMLSMIHQERTGEIINRGLLKNITQMLVDLGVNSRQVYEEDFERHFLEDSAHFYRMESQEFISSNSCSDYLIKVEARLKEEANRVAYFLDPSTEPKIRETVERELITVHMKHLIDMDNSGLIPMLRDDKIDDLSRMFHLFQRVPNGLNPMKETTANFVKETGKSLVTADAENTTPEKDSAIIKEKQEEGTTPATGPTTFIQSLLDLKDKYNNILSQAFNNDKTFKHAIDQAFEYFINLNPKSPEYISLFIDEKLKRGLKGVTDEEVEQVLDKVMMLFRFVQEKDVFEKYYKQHLAKRLLLGRSVSDDTERNMIGKLKTECGYQFTSKLEGMFNDMQLSTKTMDGFRAYLSSLSHDPMHGIDLNVQVLTTGFWPTQTVARCQVPNEINICCQVFEKYYLSNHSGRRLTWQTNMGTAELRAQFGSKKHELNVSTYQMCILLLFNTKDEYSFKEISDATSIPPPELKRNLLSLSTSKYKILSKEPNNKKVSETDVFSFNAKFKSKLYRVKIITVSGRETEPERKDTRLKVDEDRKHQIEAAIVRIMKSRKSMEHSNLISEVTRQLSSRFLPNPTIIKKRIESLIEREYIERSRNDRKIYQYLA